MPCRRRPDLAIEHSGTRLFSLREWRTLDEEPLGAEILAGDGTRILTFILQGKYRAINMLRNRIIA
jgi:hypothetical protein